MRVHVCVHVREEKIAEKTRHSSDGLREGSLSPYLQQPHSDFVVSFEPADPGWRAGWRAVFKETESGAKKGQEHD